MNRLLFQDYNAVDEVYTASPKMDLSTAGLYLDSLVADLEDFSTLNDELHQLEALEQKRLTTSGSKSIWHRGVQVSRQQLPEIIDDTRK